ncbi:MAG TPA: hypothetical protein VMC83_34080 [Streptosporangiaceae bacterium]|nr:hypothetical protein [Streptosporangiaceae bacterium]
MVVGGYRDLLVAIAGSAATLTGLLFVALSVTPRRGAAPGPMVILQVRTSAALLTFNNALAVSLFGLVPGTNVGFPSVVLGIIGIAFSAAAVRSIRASGAAARQQVFQFELIGLLLLIFGTELVSGIMVITDPRSGDAVQVIGYALITSLIVGISRAWELVGDRDTGLAASIAVLLGRPPRTEAAIADIKRSGTGQDPPAEPGDSG